MKLPEFSTHDKQFFLASIVAPLLIWWLFQGRYKFGAKGMR